MSKRGEVQGLTAKTGVTISFGERYLGSERFQAVYREGMELVEATAKYLDGDGRKEGRALKGAVSLTFATESMRLTTRLMNVASWLLIRRSVNNGEMTHERARRERVKLKLDSIGRPQHIKDYDTLPERLRSLIEASFALQDKVVKLDRLFDGGSVIETANQEQPGTSSRGAQTDERTIQNSLERIRLVFDAAAKDTHH
jgi:regulator of CtrA degradation